MIFYFDKKMPKASKVNRPDAVGISSTTPSGSSNNAHDYFYKPVVPSGLMNNA
jgi:hypothetical protein